jgi:CRISPR/Cas system CSM-associated protein Csm3 (group 7 of RAMP superfamily)
MVSMKQLHSRAEWEIELVTASAVHIGADNKEDEHTQSGAAMSALLDTPDEKTASFLLPGSSFKGTTRNYLDRLAKIFDTPILQYLINELYGESEDRKHKGRIWFGDVYISKKYEIIKNMTPINRLNQVPLAPLTLQAVRPETPFTLKMTIENATVNDYALIGLLLRAFNEQSLYIGAGSSRGLGRMQLKGCKTLIHQYGRQFVTEDNIEMPIEAFEKERKLLTTTYKRYGQGEGCYTWLQFAANQLAENLAKGELH